MKKLWNNMNTGFILLNIVIVLAICLCSGIGTVNGRTVSVIEVVFKRYDNVRKLVTWADAFSVSCSASDCFYRLPADYMRRAAHK